MRTFAINVEGEIDSQNLKTLTDNYLAALRADGALIRVATSTTHTADDMQVHELQPALDEAALVAAGHRQPAELDDRHEWVKGEHGEPVLVAKGTNERVAVDEKTGQYSR